MPSPPVLDFERLLAPISDENPSGVELREDEEGALLFGELQDAFKKARTDEREKIKQEMTLQVGTASGDSSTDPSLRREIDEPDWQTVREKAIDILAARSKDLWAAAWLTDALVRTDGIAGLRDGLKLIHDLAERYWDGIHPGPEEGSYDDTTAQLRSLIGAPLAAAIRNVPLAVGAGYSFSHYRQAVKSDSGELGPILSAVEETPATYYAELVEDLQEALSNLGQMSQYFMERCPDAAPNPVTARSELEECLNNIRTVAAGKLASVSAAEPAEGGAGTGEETTTTTPGAGKAFDVSGQIASREDAFKALLKVAEFFKKTEPTSPVPTVLEHAVRLGRKPFTELIQELVSDESIRDDIYRRIGAKLAGEDEES